MSHKKKYLKRVFILSIVMGFLLSGVNFVDFRYQLAWNTSQSVDGILFLVDRKAQVRKGDLFAFYPPINDAYFFNRKFIKYAKGSPHDMVTVDANRNVFINKKHVGLVKKESKKGRALYPILPGKIPDGFFFAWTPHPDSYDSRYQEIGLIYENNIIGRVTRLL